MRHILAVGLLVAVGAVLVGSCSSGDSDDDDNDAASGGQSGKRTANDPATRSYSADTSIAPAADLPAGEEMVLLPKGALEQLKDAGCAGWEAEPEPVNIPQGLIEFVNDISTTMTVILPGDSQTKWQITREALRQAINDLPDQVAVGISFFPGRIGVVGSTPTDNIAQCLDQSYNIEINLLDANQRAAIDERLRNMEASTGGAGTPTHDAMLIAIERVLRAQQRGVPGNPHIVLLTDGQPTVQHGCWSTAGRADPCTPQPYQPIVEVIAAAYQQLGIRTFVIGTPGSEVNECTREDVRYWLSEAARAGGTAPPNCSDQGPNYCHIDISSETNFSSNLQLALSMVLDAAVSVPCNYSLPSPPPGQVLDPNRVTMVYSDSTNDNDYLVREDSEGECTRGWRWNGNMIEICSDTCSYVNTDPLPVVNVIFGCESEQVTDIIY